MKRYAFTFAVIAVTACVFLYMFGVVAALLIAFLLALLAVAVILFYKNASKRSIAVMLLIASVFCLYLKGFEMIRVNKARDLIGQEANFVCTVEEESETYGEKTVLLVKTDSNKSSKVPGGINLRLWVSNETQASTAKLGDVLKVSGSFKEGNSLYKARNYAEQIYVDTYLESAEIIEHKETLYSYFVAIRNEIENYISANFSADQRSVLSGVLLGNTEFMSSELYSDFVVCGSLHITAVSGMHIGILCGAFLYFFSLFLNKRLASLVTLVPLFAVVAIVGFTPSALRAGIMCALLLISNALLKNTDSLNSLGVSITLMLLYNPYYICSLGFNLSCLATAGVIVFAKYGNAFCEKYIKIKWRLVNIIVCGAVSIVIQSIGAVLFTLPLQIIYFGFVSLIAPISSALICVAVSYLLVISVFGISFYYLGLGIFAQGFIFISKILAEYVAGTVKILAEIPFSYIPFSDRYALMWAGLSLALVGLWILFNKLGGIRLIALMLSAMFLVSIWSQNILERDVSEVTLINAGKGFIAAVSDKDSLVFIGCGDEQSDYNAAKTYMKLRKKEKADLVVVPSDEKFCSAGYKGFQKHIKTDKALMPEEIDQNKPLFSSNEIKITAVKAKYGWAFLITLSDSTVLVNCSGKAENTENYDYFIGTAASLGNINSKAAVLMGNLEKDHHNKTKRIVDIEDKSVTIKIIKGKGYKIYAG